MLRPAKSPQTYLPGNSVSKPASFKSRSAPAYRRLHDKACFQRAFPRSKSELADAGSALQQIATSISAGPKAVSRRLTDSGIAGTLVKYRFSYDVAMWLAGKVPGAVEIDWQEIQDFEPLDELLRQVQEPCEDEFFDSGGVSTREWMDVARAGTGRSSFDWLMSELRGKRPPAVFRQLYNAADIPLVWNLGDCPYSRSTNVFPTHRVAIRNADLRRRPRQARNEIRKPLAGITRLKRARGARLIDVAVASLATRHRETNHFDFANPDEVYLADVGKGIAIAVFGLLPAHRYPLECTMGYLILANGVPIGYGGSSVLFRQINTGINIFDEYRRSETAFLWVQVMRVYHALVGCTRYIANPYQLGEGNSEALQSGAFWFYYRLGYRPVEAGVRRFALEEQAKMRKTPGYRSPVAVLRKLASCDMHLTLPGARQREYFAEEWLPASSGLATRELGLAGGRSRSEGASRVVRKLQESLGIRSLATWTPDERRGMKVIAPFIAALDLSKWSRSELALTRKLLRAKGGKYELGFARLMGGHDRLRESLELACRRSDPGNS